MAFVIQMANFPRPFCEAAGITVKSLLKGYSSLPRVEKEKLVKGIIVELNDFRKVVVGHILPVDNGDLL